MAGTAQRQVAYC